MKELLGLPADTPPSADAFLEATHPQDRVRVDEAYRRAFESGGGRYVVEFRTRSGRWLGARGRVLFDNEGRPERSVGTILDITDAKRIEAALFEKSPVALFVIGVQQDGSFVYEEVNPVFCRYTGVTREAIVGQTPEEVFDESVTSLLNQHYGTCLRTGRRHEYEISGELPAGFLIRRTILEPIEWDENGRVRRILAAAMDLTEARQLEAALRQSQKIEALGQLTGGVAHDFNNLLTAVLGNLSMLMRNLPPGSDRRFAEHAARAAERGARLTQQLLAFARRQQMTLQLLDLNALVVDMQDLLMRTLGAQITVETELAPDLWPAIADPNQVELVVLNLAINARDAMPDGGPLRISTANLPAGDRLLPSELSGDYVMLAVTDVGLGMSEAVQARAFEPFFTTKEVGKGSGLGLSMVYGVATQSGGGATIESAPGRGTVIRVFFKRSAEAPARS
jgi:PAS domain S-box-containing protein